MLLRFCVHPVSYRSQCNLKGSGWILKNESWSSWTVTISEGLAWRITQYGSVAGCANRLDAATMLQKEGYSGVGTRRFLSSLCTGFGCPTSLPVRGICGDHCAVTWSVVCGSSTFSSPLIPFCVGLEVRHLWFVLYTWFQNSLSLPWILIIL